MWYLLWFVGILLMCSLSTLVLVWLDPRLKLTNVSLMWRISIASGNQ